MIGHRVASYNFAWASRQRTNSVLLNTQGSGCEMQIQSSYRGIAHDDAADFKEARGRFPGQAEKGGAFRARQTGGRQEITLELEAKPVPPPVPAGPIGLEVF
ncbi:MAG: hypothetical protein ACLPX8_04090 [Bryobacteraceae bacterium]|jgi:hypothetical protein